MQLSIDLYEYTSCMLNGPQHVQFCYCKAYCKIFMTENLRREFVVKKAS